jgi:hypothetical protein
VAELAIKGSTSPEDVAVIGEMRVMGRKGDTRIIWNPDNADEVAQARKTFDDLKSKRFVAYTVSPGGGKGEQVSEFDPGAEKMILAPPMAGG